MAIAYSRVAGATRVEGNKRIKTYDLTFSGNYATGGEAWTVGTGGFGNKKVDFIRLPGVANSADVATSIPVGADYTNGKFLFYEGSAAGTALSEKTNAEAYPTGLTMRVEVVGY